MNAEYFKNLIQELSETRSVDKERSMKNMMTYTNALYLVLSHALKDTRFKTNKMWTTLDGIQAEIVEDGTPYVYDIIINVRERK